MENRTAFIFAGQGAQHPGMGAALCQESRAAAEVFRRADAVLGWSISHLCFEGTMEELTACAACQPAIFVCSLAGYAAFREKAGEDWKPVSVGGLSLGELSALTAAGAVDFETGLRMVARRGELMDQCCKRRSGAMGAVVGCPEEELEAACREAGVWVANYNCPGQRIVSGLQENVEKCLSLLEGKAMKLQKLTVAGAFHSPLMEDAAKAFREYLDTVDIQVPAIPMVHNVTGDWTDAPGSPSLRDLLGRQVCSPVRWEQCAGKLMDCSDAMEETGPGKVLQGLCRRIRRGFPVHSMEL
jgi:[acyl-carrier-protein] S-malonyltransferase